MKNGTAVLSKPLVEESAKLTAQIKALEIQKSKIETAIESLGVVKARRGRKPGSKNKATKVAKVAKSGKTGKKGKKGAGRPKGSMNPTSLGAVLLRIAPASDISPVDKTTLLAKVAKTGYKSKGNLGVILSTTLSKSDFFESVDVEGKRGFWRRSKAGDAQLAVIDAKVNEKTE
jgi:hypothetical protein